MMRNQSGYVDPTAAKAIGLVTAETRRAERRPLVYICSPYRGDVDNNIQKAKKYCQFAIDKQVTPIATHLMYPQVLGKTETRKTRELAMSMGRNIIKRCRELWWFGDHQTDGMKDEIEYARHKALIIRHFSENCEEIPLAWKAQEERDYDPD